MFHVGQKVVCVAKVREIPQVRHLCEAVPQAGQVYTIRAIEEADPLFYGGDLAFLLCEIRNCERLGRGEPNFHSNLFRPLTDTSISDVLAKAAPRDSRKWDNRRKVREKA